MTCSIDAVMPLVDVDRAAVALGGDQVWRALFPGADRADRKRAGALDVELFDDLEDPIGNRAEFPECRGIRVGHVDRVAAVAVGDGAERIHRFGKIILVIRRGVQGWQVTHGFEPAAAEAAVLAHAIARATNDEILDPIAVEVSSGQVAHASPGLDDRGRILAEVTVAGVGEDDELAVEWGGSNDIRLVVTGNVSADDAAQFLGSRVEVLGSAEGARSVAEVDGDRAVEVADRQIRPAVVIEIRFADSLWTLAPVCGDVGVSHVEPIAESFEIFE